MTFAFGPILMLATEKKSKALIDHPTQKGIEERAAKVVFVSPFVRGCWFM
jgi:hypothetical protein